MKPTFVFLHVGTDPNIEYFIKSILLLMPDAEIIQCSDLNTQKVEGVTKVFRYDGEVANLMTFRLNIFYMLQLGYPAIYLDTDMLICKKLNPTALLDTMDVICCQRTFRLDKIFNEKFLDMDFSEYDNKTFGEIYPIVACFTIARSFRFWEECFNNLMKLHPKFHIWFGDQEAMRNVSLTNKFRVGYLPESEVGCLPEFFNKKNVPAALHFKGAFRKDHMKFVFEKLFL